MNDQKLQFWTKYLELVSLLFALVGVFWAVTGMLDPFGIYDQLLAETFWSQKTLPVDAETTFRFILGPLGATCAGYFLMQFYLARYAFSKKEIWGYWAVAIPFLVWFSLDTIMCFAHGAYFNILLANVPSVLAMTPVFFSYKYFNKSHIKNN